MMKRTNTTGSTVTPCSAVHAAELCRGCARSHSPFTIENHVQSMTAATPNATPIQNSVGDSAAAVMYLNSDQLAITRPTRMTMRGGVMALQESARSEPRHRKLDEMATRTGMTAMNMPANGAPARRMHMVMRL